MRTLAFIFGLLFFVNLNARNNDDNLQIAREGLVVVVVDFKDGDKIKLFEVETGDHILSKTRGQIDLSQLPSGKYLLENNEGQSVVIEKTDIDIIIDEALGTDYIVERDSDAMPVNDMSVEEELENYYSKSELNPLDILREGDLVTVLNFEEGDKIKLFEVVDKVHVLSKTTETVDLAQLPAGKYILENNYGQSVVIEMFEDVQDGTIVAYN
ncbi:hypothetical protein [Aquimarina sp. 2201CG14-23]|uniref:hypothetical protein n=1 Tax=Aquimarina mycalae TaxID=3040073 RepID=UPI0024782181|nr:hypothetical protein [Aquimarina sp. 2201CG14-23]MDH7444441.1 hypothetical protein [Aquimarina sp. 2201CG14-23]